MFAKFLASALLGILCAVSVYGACSRDRNVVIKKPLYLNYGSGFFFIQGLSNGESVVIYKHPDDTRIFGQYTFKDQRCLYETVYYYVLNERYEFTNPYVTEEVGFNITNKISFVTNGIGYEIEYNVSPRGVGIFHNLGAEAERKVLPEPIIKRVAAPQNLRGKYPNFGNIGKQNLKVSFLKNGENHIQFIGHRNQFSSVEGQYTLLTSDGKYHSFTYEIPIGDFDYNGLSMREYEISDEDNFFKTGTLELSMNGTAMDARWYVNSKGFFISDLKRLSPSLDLNPAPPALVSNSRPVRNQPRVSGLGAVLNRVLNPSFSRPELLTGNRSVQPGK